MITLEKERPATKPAAQEVWQHRLRRSGYFVGAVLLHLILFLLVATWVIFKAPAPPTDDFGQVKSIPVKVPPPPTPPSSSDAANNPQLEPQQVVVPVVTPPSLITSVNTSFTVDSRKLLDQALRHVALPTPQGTGLAVGPSGGGGSGGGGVGGTDYGSGTGTPGQFVGHLYDLKQTPNRKPTDIADSAANGLNFLRTFVKDWNMDSLSSYFMAPGTLYASQICIRERHSDESTKAFGVDGVVDPKRWIIVYDAKVAAPDNGTYRFVGWADDFMVVRWNGENVLDASYDGEGLDPSAKVETTGSPGGQALRCGKWIQMQAGDSVPMKVLIGEGPGGYSGFLLLIEKQGDDSKDGDYPLFQVLDAQIPDLGNGFTFTKKKMLFQSSPE